MQGGMMKTEVVRIVDWLLWWWLMADGISVDAPSISAPGVMCLRCAAYLVERIESKSAGRAFRQTTPVSVNATTMGNVELNGSTFG